MCGIAGIIKKDGNFDLAATQRMLDALASRGPDDEGRYQNGHAFLGQRRLSIIDLEGGHQPIPNEDETVWVICNGEIYNYQEIRERLIEKGHTFRTKSDSEVVMHLYEEMGEDCVHEFRGMFAFAIWDQNKQRLFAARDRLGQKPFYYAEINGDFVFASEIKGLLAYQPDLAELNHQALDEYLTLRIITPPRSMYRRIHKLPPAHRLSFDLKQGLKIDQYWDLYYQPKFTASEDQLTDQLEEVLIEALRLHMVSDVPVGAFLSGGMDSTLVVSMLMKHVAKEPIATFTMGLPYGEFNEAPFAAMVAKQYGTLHHEQIVTPSLTQTLPDLINFLDEPSDPLSVCTYLVSKLARQHVKVVLGGDGGDELFGGYDRYYGNQYADIIAAVPKPIRQFLIGPLLSLIPDGGWYKSKAHQLKWLYELSFLSGSKRYSNSLSYFYFGPSWRNTLYGDAMMAGIGNFQPESSIWTAFDKAKADNLIDKMLYADSFIRMPDHPVMISDRMTMANSLEARAPLMDHKVAEFAARLPVSMKVKGRKLRVVQKRLLERYLPKEVLERPKQGFSSALPYMLADEYKLLFNVFLQDSHLARDRLLQQKAITNLLNEHLGGRKDNGNRLWLLLNSEVWYRMMIQGQSKDDIYRLIGAAK